MARTPILMVHGIWDDGACFDSMRDALETAGRSPLEAIDLRPNDGSARIEVLADQVEEAATSLLRRTGATTLDLIGFSMGALVSRFWIQRLGGKARTKRFISISGPHGGTATAWVIPRNGVRQMRPRSQLLQELDADEDPWGDCVVHAIWTPFDLMILPAHSSRLPGAREHKVRVPMHRFMITHPDSIRLVTQLLRP